MNKEFPFSKAARSSAADKVRDMGLRQFTLVISITALFASVIFSALSFQATRTSIAQANRAWVGLAGMPVIDHVATTPKWRVDYHFEVKNFGRGPALKVVSTALFVTEPGLAALASESQFVCGSAQSFSTATRPKGSIPQAGRFGDTLFPEQSITEPALPLGRFWEGDKTPKFFYLIGCVAYTDQFKQSHWTRFCLLGHIEQGVLMEWNYYSMYNDTDEIGS